MNLPTLEMPVEEARREYLTYRKAIENDRFAEYEIIRKSYHALSKGHAIVNVRDAIKAAGAHEDGSPKLAIARADDQWCYFSRQWASGGGSTTSLRFTATQRWTYRNRAEIFEDVLPPLPSNSRYGGRWGGKSVVPLVPPALCPKAELSNYHILWEAEWERVPVDPALLKRIEGDLFAVLAVWDLTEVERMALGLRRES